MRTLISRLREERLSQQDIGHIDTRKQKHNAGKCQQQGHRVFQFLRGIVPAAAAWQ